MGISGSFGKALAPQVYKLAPELTSGFIHESLQRAIHGVGPLPGAAHAAEKQLEEQDGDVHAGIHEVIENHVRYAGAQGFATNLGGVMTAAVAIPANIAGLAVIQARMIAGIAHLRGYDLHDPRVHNAILTCMLGEELVTKLVRRQVIPAPPMALATAPTHDPHLSKVIANEVTGELLTKVAGKRVAVTVGRRVPVVGGLVGAGADGFATWRIGRYTDRELLPRTRR